MIGGRDCRRRGYDDQVQDRVRLRGGRRATLTSVLLTTCLLSLVVVEELALVAAVEVKENALDEVIVLLGGEAVVDALILLNLTIKLLIFPPLLPLVRFISFPLSIC